MRRGNVLTMFAGKGTHFSLQEEAIHTERNRTEWTPMSQLRYKKVSFVSAGITASIEDEKTVRDETVDSASILLNLEDRPVEKDIDFNSTLADLKEMAIDSNSTLILSEETNEPEILYFDAEPRAPTITKTSDACQSPDHKPHAQIASLTSQQFSEFGFFVDTQGQQPLSKPMSPPTIRSPSPSGSSSGEDEIVFRGRNPVGKVVDDPVSELVHTSRLALSTDTWNVGSTPWTHRSKPGVGWTVPQSVAITPSQTHKVKLPVESEPWNVDKPHPSTFCSTNNAVPDKPGMSTRASASSPSKTTTEVDDEDAILQDYIDNMREDSGSDIDLSTFQPRELDVGLSSSHQKFQVSTSNTEDEADNQFSKASSKAKRAEDLDSDDEQDEDTEDESDQDDDSIADDMDLVERRMAQLDDENIARLLAKQDEIGILTDDLVLFDDDVVAKEARAYSKKTPKSARRVKQTLDVSFATELEDLSYGEFDIMDFERPSLQPRKKGKGRRTEPDFELVVTDSDLEVTLRRAWNKDRETKKAKKEAREELRSQGLLGKKKNGKPDLTEKYSEGLSVDEFRRELKDFLDSQKERISFPPMQKTHRKALHELAASFGLRSKSTGSGKNRYTTLVTTRNTIPFNEKVFQAKARKINQGFFPRIDARASQGTKAVKVPRTHGGGNSAGVTYREGEVVGGTAAEISSDNRGRIMLEKMGWSQGTGLGTDRAGIQVPIAHVVKNTKAGLG
jgi:hypothetical protein